MARMKSVMCFRTVAVNAKASNKDAIRSCEAHRSLQFENVEKMSH